MSTSLGRNVRLMGAIVLVAMFAAGFFAGVAWRRVRPGGVDINVRMSSKIPAELRRLGLSDAQNDSLAHILFQGQQRMRGVLREFEPRMRATIDSVDAEIKSVLTADQRTRLDQSRKRLTEDVRIDTVKR